MMRTLDTEARSPKYAHVERERRFLVDPRLRPDLGGRASILIEDRYLTGTRLRLRRMTDSATGETTVKLTKKYEAADPLARPIVTSYLAEAEYALLATLPALALVKRRYPFRLDAGEIGVDVFEGPLTGLETAETELATDESLRAFAAPPWAVRDVSGDDRFQGSNLATLDAEALSALLQACRARGGRVSIT